MKQGGDVEPAHVSVVALGKMDRGLQRPVGLFGIIHMYQNLSA